MSSCPTDSEEADMQQEAEGFSASRQELGAWKMWIVTRCRLQAPIVNFALSQYDDVEAQSTRLRLENRPFSLKTVVLEADARHTKRFRVLHHREGERKNASKYGSNATAQST